MSSLQNDDDHHHHDHNYHSGTIYSSENLFESIHYPGSLTAQGRDCPSVVTGGENCNKFKSFILTRTIKAMSPENQTKFIIYLFLLQELTEAFRICCNARISTFITPLIFIYMRLTRCCLKEIELLHS